MLAGLLADGRPSRARSHGEPGRCFTGCRGGGGGIRVRSRIGLRAEAVSQEAGV